MQHLRMALVTQVWWVPNQGDHSCEITHHMEVCTTISHHFWPPNHVGLHVAHCFHFQAHRTHVQPTKLNPNVPAIMPALYTKPHVMQSLKDSQKQGQKLQRLLSEHYLTAL